MRASWWLVGLMLVLGSGSAQGFELKRDDFGFPVRWIDPVVTWQVDGRGPADFELQAAVRVAKTVYGAWGDHLEGVTLEFGGLTEVDVVGYQRGADARNRNLLIFSRADWPFESSKALAMTVTTYRQRGKGLVDADIVINEQTHRWRDGGAGDGTTYDLGNTLAHEVGHMMGLAHSDDPEATMYAQAFPSETSKRDLHADDVAGLRALYGAEGAPLPAQAPLPHMGEVQVSRTGCVQFDLPAEPTSVLFGAALLLALLGRRFLSVAVVLFALVGPARASVMEGLSLERLVADAAVVFEGEVAAVERHWEGGFVVAEATVTVSRCYQGPCAETVVVRSFGGTLDGLRQDVSGAPQFDAGEQVLVFGAPSQRAAQQLQVVGLAQGKFRVVDGPGGGWAFRDPGGLHLVGPASAAARAWHFVALDALRARLTELGAR